MEIKHAAKVSIESLVVCRLDDGKQQWIPKTKSIGNTKLMMLSKWDRGFTKFVTGKSLDLRSSKAKSLNATPAGAFLDDLCRKRKEACELAVHESLEAGDDTGKPKAKKRKVALTDQHAVLKPLVQITLPACSNPEMPERIVQCAFNTGPSLWIEVNEMTLLQIITGCRECNEQTGRARKKASPKVKHGKKQSPKKEGVNCDESQNLDDANQGGAGGA